MTNRPRHRRHALIRRWLRVENGLPADGSQRERNPKQPRQLRVSAFLRGVR